MRDARYDMVVVTTPHRIHLWRWRRLLASAIYVASWLRRAQKATGEVWDLLRSVAVAAAAPLPRRGKQLSRRGGEMATVVAGLHNGSANDNMDVIDVFQRHGEVAAGWAEPYRSVVTVPQLLYRRASCATLHAVTALFSYFRTA